jgi:hypothetical protein
VPDATSCSIGVKRRSYLCLLCAAHYAIQFNRYKNNDDLLSAISWINNNTEDNAIIVGEKHRSLIGFIDTRPIVIKSFPI